MIRSPFFPPLSNAVSRQGISRQRPSEVYSGGFFFVELLNNHLRVAVVLLPGASRVSIIASATDVKVKLPRCDNVTL